MKVGRDRLDTRSCTVGIMCASDVIAVLVQVMILPISGLGSKLIAGTGDRSVVCSEPCGILAPTGKKLQ